MRLTVAQALGMTLIVFGGSAQLAALPLIVAAAPIWVTAGACRWPISTTATAPGAISAGNCGTSRR